MAVVNLQKTLIALAITAAAHPVYAETIALTNAGVQIENASYADHVEVNGAFSSNNSDLDAIEFNSVTFNKDLVINATVKANGTNSDGLDLSMAGEDEDPSSFGPATEILGNLVNKGSITVSGDGVSAMLVDPAIIHGDLINEGTLSVSGNEFEGDGIRALEFSGQSELHGDLINASTGQILASGTNAKGILLEGGEIDGKLINNGLIQVSGKNATALDATSNEYFIYTDRVDIGGIENNGRIIATGDDAVGVELDGVSFTSSSAQLINNGLIQATDAAIEIGGFDLDGEAEGSALTLVNRGTLISEDEAIDASEASDTVVLDWQGGSITGNLIDLDRIYVTGDALFKGTNTDADGYNIRMFDNGPLMIGTEGTAGHLQLVNAHTSLQGDLLVGNGSSLDLNLSSATDASKAVLSVDGTATFEKGSQITLAAQGSDFSANGSTYTLVQADSLDNQTEDGKLVSSRSSLLNVDTYVIEGNQVVATVTSKSASEVGEVIKDIGGSNNAQRAASAFSNVAAQLATLNPQDKVFQSYVNASQDAKALRALAEQLTPEVNGGATQAATTGQTLISNVTGARTSGAHGMSSGEGFKETGVWVQTLYSDASQDLRDNVAGYNAYSRGIAVGADGKLNDQVTLGVAYSYLNTDVNGKTGDKTKVDGHAFTLYGGFEQGNYFVDASLTYGLNDNESKRSIAGTTAKADYDSNLFGVNLVGGYTYHISPSVLVEPRLAARYSLVDIDGYREKGSSAALKVEDQRFEVAELGAGLRVAGSFPLGNGTFEPQAKVMAYHDFIGDEVSSTSTFVSGNTPFVTSGASAVRNSYEAGVGADYHLGAVTVGLNYDYVGKSDFEANTFTAKVRYDF
ncbi:MULTISPECIES: autotransporter outer membrane beta-barrel domain-containing protein [unclassified Pseudomonas]|uniref:autotransporter family protein n=1 Tax=unclassified Pseudomonas TaxID=196821 RepID=UPI0021BA5CA3|nr:autotransporter outer membrane beta-barrel domain-containing protein [Pseudomonas sp. HD6422]MCT8166554.1 autotransporter domain-containing protein [Pseudomonas sp. HD6422]MCT8185400.1 autotransporter domain-containing protein [Pseudomonas sp. HD6421]